MPESKHDKYKFSVTCKVVDAAVLSCLRALCQHAEKSNYKQIGWGGTKEVDWVRNDQRATFRFTNPEYRKVFLHEAQRILPEGSWSKVSTNDNDPAHPQR